MFKKVLVAVVAAGAMSVPLAGVAWTDRPDDPGLPGSGRIGQSWLPGSGQTGQSWLPGSGPRDFPGALPAPRCVRSPSDGDLLFVAVRPTEDDDKPPAALWSLPAAGGEAVEVVSPPGGVELVRTARDAARAVVRAPLLPSADGIDDDRRLRNLRKDNKISAILHTGYPIRHWDKDLGPGEPHLLGLDLADGGAPVDLTPQPGGALRDADFDVSPDGRFLVTSWQRPAPDASQHSVLVRIDLTSGDHTVIADEPDADLWSPTISPDGSAVAFIRESYSTPARAPRITLGYLRFGERPVEARARTGIAGRCR